MSLASVQGERVHGNAGAARLTRATLALTVFCGGFVFMEPAPYEFAFALLCIAVLIQGTRIPALLILPIGCLTVWICGGMLAIAANGSDSKAGIYLAISGYLALSTIIFAAISAERPEKISGTIRSAWLAAAFVTTTAGVLGYFELVPGSSQFQLYGRARGMFKDPNVFAPFLIFPALLLLQDILLSRNLKRVLPSAALLALVLAGILLSFSRASWGHLIVSGALMAGLMFLTSATNFLRIRIIGAAFLALVLGAAVVAGLLAIPSVAEVFFARADLMQDYDAGQYGRFGTQLRSLPELLHSPFGFGPYGFAERYIQDPHNVYLNAFASYGWLGGFSYLLFVLMTLVVGLCAVVIRTPWQQFHIAAFATFAGVALEGVVIDTDHWRHYFLLAGLVWGLSAATRNYRKSLQDWS